MTDLRISVAQAHADSRFYAHQIESTRREQVKLRERVVVKRYDNNLPLTSDWMD